MSRNPKLTSPQFLAECFAYDPLTGAFWWAHRPSRHFVFPDAHIRWNERFAGKETGIVDKGGYLRLRVTVDGKNRSIPASHVAFALVHGRVPETLDHINGNRTDNRIGNLREVTRSQNHMNRPGWGSTGLPKGVQQLDSGRFSARFWNGSSYEHLGTFDHVDDATAAWTAKARPAHGQYFCERATL